MTPLELSIDLGRNDITFLLISLRGGAPGKPAAAAVSTGPAPANQPAGKPAPVRQAAARPAPRPAPAAKPAPAPAQFADVPSTPVPQAGFLGFGNNAAARRLRPAPFAGGSRSRTRARK